MKMNLTGAIEILKLHKHTTDKFKHSVGDQYVSDAIDTVLTAFTKPKQMTAEEYIIKEYGEPWLEIDWSPGDVMDIMEDYAKYRIEEEERLFRERIEADAELWGRVGANPPRPKLEGR